MVYSRIKALVIIALSTLIVSGSAAATLLFFHFRHYLHEKNERYSIRSIVQTSPTFQALPNVAFEEMLQLSLDKPINIESFDLQVAESKLLMTKIFQYVNLRKFPPSTLHIDYSLKKPIGYYADLSNTFLDSQGHLFPAFPYFTPKNLPEIFVGSYQEPIEKKKMEIIQTILTQLHGTQLSRIDLTHLDHPSLGQKEVVVILKYKARERTLRLNPKEIHQQLKNYIALEKSHLCDNKEPKIIDLRLAKIAYIKNGVP